jgi:hypothetical protein
MRFPAGKLSALMSTAAVLIALTLAYAQQEQRGQASYIPVDIKASFKSIGARLSAAKPQVEKEHNALLNERYELSDQPAQGVTMSRGKAVQEGVRVKLPQGMVPVHRSIAIASTHLHCAA